MDIRFVPFAQHLGISEALLLKWKAHTSQTVRLLNRKFLRSKVNLNRPKLNATSKKALSIFSRLTGKQFFALSKAKQAALPFRIYVRL
jgi:hypothetical protein